MSDVTSQAAALGFATTTDESLRPEPDAVRMLPADANAVPLSLAGGVLSVLVDHIPSAAEFTAFETASGCAVTVTVTTPQVLAAVRARAEQDVRGGRDLGAILAEVPDEATGLHLAAGGAPAVRVRGELRPLESWPALSAQDVTAAVEFVTGSPAAPDGQYVVSWAGQRWRAVLLTAGGHQQLTLRQIPAPARLEQLGLPAAAAQTIDLPGGLVPIGGRVGSGKSMTLGALLDKINATRRVWISTVEDPVELTLPARHAVVTQRSVGRDCPSVCAAVEAAVAAGVNVLAVTAPLTGRQDLLAVLRAAAAGALVYVTVPAATVRGALSGMLALVPDAERLGVSTQLAEVFAAGIAQQLLPTREGGLVPAVEVVWGSPAVAAVLRQDRLTELDSAAAADPSGRSATMSTAVEALLASRRVSDSAAAAWRAAHPAPSGVLAGYLTHTADVDVDDTDLADSPTPATDTEPTPAAAAGLLAPQAPTRSSRRAAKLGRDRDKGSRGGGKGTVTITRQG